MPTAMIAASITRAVTIPSATPSFCLLTTGKIATALPIPAGIRSISRNAATKMRGSAPAPRT